MPRWANAALFFALATSLPLHAGSFVWTGLAFDGDWTTPPNWRGGVLPPSDGTAEITLGPAANVSWGYTYLNLSSDQDIGALKFVGALAPYDIWGSSLTIRNGLTYSPDSAVDTYTESDLSINLAQSQTWNITKGSLEINGTLIGSVTLTKSGGGELRLWGDSRPDGSSGFTGNLVLSEGGLLLGYDYALGAGTLVINGGSVPYLTTWADYPVALNNDVILNGGSFQTILKSALFLDGPITLTADTTIAPQTHEPLYLSGNITEDAPSRSLTVNGPGVVALTGLNSYTGGTVVNNGVLIFGADDSIPTEGLLKTTGDGYIGLATAPEDLQGSFIDQFDKENTTGTIGFDTGPDSEINTFDGDIDLSDAPTDTAFNGAARLGSATQAILTGTITPQGSTYNFGGGGGWLEVDSYLTGANSVVVNSPAHAPLTVHFDPSAGEYPDNDYSGGTTVTQSAVIFAATGALPSTGNLNLGPGGYIGLEDVSDLETLDAFLARFPTDTSQGIIGFDSSGGGVTIFNESPVDLMAFTNPTFYLGTATSATISDPILLTSTATAYRFAGYKGGQLEIASALEDDVLPRSVIIGDPDVPATFNDPTQANSSDLSTVKLNGDNSYTGGTTLYAGRLVVSQANSSELPTTALGAATGTLTIQPVNFTHDSSLRPTLQLGALTISNPIVLNTDLNLEVWGDTDYTLGGAISGNGALYVDTSSGGGTVVLGVDNSFSGGVHVGTEDNEGWITFASNGAAGSGPLEVVNGVATFTSPHPVIYGLSSPNNDSGSIELTYDNASFTVDQAGDSRFYGSIVSYSEGNPGLIKNGTGRLFLENSSYYSGGTTINDGALIAGDNNALGSGTVTLSGGKLALEYGVTLSNDLVLTSGKLGGYGTFDPPTRPAIGVNIILAPGANALTAPGTLSFGSNGLTFASDGTYNWQLQSVDAGEGIGWDLIDVFDSGATLDNAGGVFTAGVLNITAMSGPSSPFTVKLISLDADGNNGPVADFDANTSYSWPIASATGGITYFDSTSFFLDTSGFQNPLNDGTFSLSLGDGDTGLYLNFTPVPEPSTYALMGLGLGMLWVGYRRRKSRLH